MTEDLKVFQGQAHPFDIKDVGTVIAEEILRKMSDEVTKTISSIVLKRVGYSSQFGEHLFITKFLDGEVMTYTLYTKLPLSDLFDALDKFIKIARFNKWGDEQGLTELAALYLFTDFLEWKDECLPNFSHIAIDKARIEKYEVLEDIKKHIPVEYMHIVKGAARALADR